MSRYPLFEQPAFAFVLSALGGLLNAWTFAKTQMFATAQTGNVVMVGYRLMQKDWTAFWQVTMSVLAFGIGVMVAGGLIWLRVRRSRRYVPVLQVTVIAALILAIVLIEFTSVDPHHVAWIVAFAGGVQASGFREVDGVHYSSVGMTQGSVESFAYLADAISTKYAPNGKTNLEMSGLHFLVLMGFASGGALGFAVDHWLDGSSILVAIAAATAILIVSMAKQKDPAPVPNRAQ